QIAELDQHIAQALWVANRIQAIALTDHNTVMGLEPLLASLSEECRLGIIAGAEMTTCLQIDANRTLGLHLLAYFRLKGASPDLHQLNQDERQSFFAGLRRDYVPLLNKVLEGVNERFGVYLPELIAEKNPELGITEEEISDAAKARLAPLDNLLAQCHIKPGDQPIVVAHTDVARLLERRGYSSAAAHSMLGRSGEFYIGYDHPWRRYPIQELAREFRDIAKDSPVDVRLSLAHPYTYVRWFRKNGATQSVAYSRVDTIIRDLHAGGLLDAIEVLYPQYHRRFLAQHEADSETIWKENRISATEIRKERYHAEEAQRHFGNLARELGLKVTGGSDFHGVPDTRMIGIGNGELAVPSRLARELFDLEP
ncbi:MAG TPA: hypothetical protein VJK52_03185, partial [Candidatus Nanoarchaeia archaeon]|nr:hypothetical protein [Candidatus Nanoarchaeia archaeon]